MHNVAAGIDDNPNGPRTRVCRHCATEVLLWGLKEWWIRERQKGHLDVAVANRPDCEQGSACSRQKDLGASHSNIHLKCLLTFLNSSTCQRMWDRFVTVVS